MRSFHSSLLINWNVIDNEMWHGATKRFHNSIAQKLGTHFRLSIFVCQVKALFCWSLKLCGSRSLQVFVSRLPLTHCVYCTLVNIEYALSTAFLYGTCTKRNGVSPKKIKSSRLRFRKYTWMFDQDLSGDQRWLTRDNAEFLVSELVDTAHT